MPTISIEGAGPKIEQAPTGKAYGDPRVHLLTKKLACSVRE
jgi:hypothetical protein